MNTPKHIPFYLLALLFLVLGIHKPASSAAFPAPPVLISPKGERFEMDTYAGQILLVNVWASWCGPCRHEMPDLDELQTHFADEPFTVLGVAADEMEGVKAYLKSIPVAYPNYAGDPDLVFAWSQKLGNYQLGVPYSALVDTTGTIRWTKMGGRITKDEVAPIISELLNELSEDDNTSNREPK